MHASPQFLSLHQGDATYTARALAHEAATLDNARALGIALPIFRLHEAPDLFASWADRVALAVSRRDAGRLTDDLLDECDRQLGLPASRTKAPTAFATGAGWFGRLTSPAGAA